MVTQIDVRDRAGDVVHPRGSTGVIIHAPGDVAHRYRVSFPGGEQTTLERGEMEVLGHFQQAGIDNNEVDLWQFVIYRCVIGSRAYGLDHDASDTDRRGIYQPPADVLWSLYGVPEQLENEQAQECYWELEKFLKLALKANPNVLEVLYSPIVEHTTTIAEELLSIRHLLLSKLIYQTYNGYAMSQFRKLGQDIRKQGSIKWKHAMHLIRLLLAGIRALREQTVAVRVADEHRDRLMAIRDGEMAWEDIDAWRLELHREFEKAFGETELPERPDYDAANEFLIRARRSVT